MNWHNTFHNFKRTIFSNGSDESRRNSDDDDNEQPRKGQNSATERFKRRMSYVPPRYRKNSVNKSAAASRANTSKKKDMSEKTMSALSKRSVRNFDDKKYKSNSHLTPVDW